MSQPPRIAVIGAGMAGLTCAAELAAAGASVDVFEKSRGIGGRMATRRTPEGFEFDHGCPAIIATDPHFIQHLAALEAQGAASSWQPVDPWIRADHQPLLWTGVPRMNALLGPLTSPLKLHFENRITLVTDGSLVSAVDGHLDPFDHIVVAVPGPQALEMLRDVPDLAEPLGAVTMAPSWALMAAFSATVYCPWDRLEADHEEISPEFVKVVRNTAKPGRMSTPNCWVAHTSASWAREHLWQLPEEVEAALEAPLRASLGGTRQGLIHLKAHRWLYGSAEKHLDTDYLTSACGRITVAGDWCSGGEAEAAFRSGRAAARAIASALDLPVAPTP